LNLNVPLLSPVRADKVSLLRVPTGLRLSSESKVNTSITELSTVDGAYETGAPR